MISDANKIELCDLISELSNEVISIQKKDFNYSFKKDCSPLTEADTFVNEKIRAYIGNNFKFKNIISEEDKLIDFETRKSWDLYWVLDPIDGTKEFIKKNDDFTINLALCKGKEPVFSIVARPGTGDIYTAAKNEGAFKNAKKISTSNENNENQKIKIVASKSHVDNETKKLIEELNSKYSVDTINIGSSLKICLIAEGKANLYPRFGPTMEWDTCAAQLILEEAGGYITSTFNKNIIYNKEDLLNPHFICWGNLCEETKNFVKNKLRKK